jgi:hypothetical protein
LFEDDSKKEVWQSQASAAVFPLSVKEVSNSDMFKIYPNPTETNFTIEFNEATIR